MYRDEWIRDELKNGSKIGMVQAEMTWLASIGLLPLFPSKNDEDDDR